jgi:uncharacterized protein DUF6600
MPRMSPTCWLTLAVIGYTVAAASGCAGSQYPDGPAPQAPGGPTDDPPARVGRLSYIEGSVSFLAASADSWAVAEPNRPVTTGDRIWADNAARAEVDLGSTALRLSTQTELDVVRLTDHWLQVRLPQGTLNQRVKILAPTADDEIDTPNAAVSLTRAGEYRVSVSPDGETTTITVWSGGAQVTAAGSSFPVEARQVATIRGDSALTYDLTDAGAPDDFDRWAQTRDARADEATASLRYVSEDMPGVEDLDPYGRWDSHPDYGAIWYPTTVEVGWAPYRQGHWIWIGRWGWTWVDEAPWGFAPYHYGRWAFVRGRWGWCPGRTIAEPVFAPALVVFVGGPTWRPTAEFGPGGGVAWFPLAPGEVYYPAYAAGVEYRRRINVTNVTNVTIINNVTNVTNVTYRNRGVPGAVTAVPARAFVGAQPVRRAAVPIPVGELTSARVAAAAPIAPTAASLAAGVPGRRAPLPPARLETRPAVATHAPPPAPVPFATQQRELEASNGRPLTRSQLTALRPAVSPTHPEGPPIRSAEATGPSDRGLTPARPKLPVTPEPATNVFAPRAPTPQPPVAAPSKVQRPAPAPAAPAPPASLDRSYQAERSAEEARHRQEFAKPPTGESPAALEQRQEAEHQDLEQRYQRARASGAPAMPPAAASKAPKAAPKAPKSESKERRKE